MNVKFSNITEAVQLSIHGIISNSVLVLAPGEDKIVNNFNLVKNYQSVAANIKHYLKVEETREEETPESDDELETEDEPSGDEDPEKDEPAVVKDGKVDEEEEEDEEEGDENPEPPTPSPEQSENSEGPAPEPEAAITDPRLTPKPEPTATEPTAEEIAAIEASKAQAREAKIKELVHQNDKPALIKICSDSNLPTDGDKTVLATRIFDNLQDL